MHRITSLTPGIDFHETFSSVVKPSTVRLVLSIAIQKHWHIHQLDVNNAFLQGTLEDEVYMKQPPGFADSTFPTHMCRLKRPIYGLRQSPRAWSNELKNYLLSVGFTRSYSDTSLFIMHTHAFTIYVLVYVDDIVITGSHVNIVQQIIHGLASRFSIKDLGPLNYFLGVQVIHNEDHIILSQAKYIQDLLAETNMLDCNGVSTPMSTSVHLIIDNNAPIHNVTEYRRILGKLQYLSFTRPDLSYVVNKLSQFMHSPQDQHWHAVKRVLRYLKSTSMIGLKLSSKPNNALTAYSDSDWAGNPSDRTSTTGYVIYHGNSPISWCSKKQRAVARSSTEAEYRAVACTVAELNWLSNLLRELQVPMPCTPRVFCDNVGATFLCQNPVFHSRMKHIAVDFHFVREQVHNKTLEVTHVHSADQVADSLTKPLPKSTFDAQFIKLALVNTTPILRGRNKARITEYAEEPELQKKDN